MSGPSFFTKFLYFAGKTVPPASGPEPLILDRVLSRRLRSLAAVAGRKTGHDSDGSVAAWVGRDRDWPPHRYEVPLSFLHAGGGNGRLAVQRLVRPARVRAVPCRVGASRPPQHSRAQVAGRFPDMEQSIGRALGEGTTPRDGLGTCRSVEGVSGSARPRPLWSPAPAGRRARRSRQRVGRRG
ncbi:hypothetical protein ACH4VM_38120 [Streptomyces sp. NPDC020792]|uniref:8-oxoguanine DNA glycosylase OGG fold protein n=1 Tax=Streptomyces sp. NPDC020792 TaxID=3365089 RepID=UPI0037A0BC7C